MRLSLTQILRKVHRWAAIIISVPIIFVIGTGIFLQVRKPIEWIQPDLEFGVARNQPTASLEAILESLKTIPEMNVTGWKDVRLLDLRPKQGTIKVRNYDEFEAQLDAKSAQVLKTGQRWNDIVVLMHEGSTWDLRLAVFLPAAVIALFLTLTGSALAIVVSRQRLRRWQQKRAELSRNRSANVRELTPAATGRSFNLMTFCHKYHLYMGLVVLLPCLVVLTSGIALQIRYEVLWVMPQLQTGTSTTPKLEFEQALAKAALLPRRGVTNWPDVWRIYVYPSRGIVSIRARNRQQIQLDAQTGELLDVSIRRTDLIEDIHEGKWLGANLWLFLPIHIISIFLWLLGVIMWSIPLFVAKSTKADTVPSAVR